MTGNTTTLMAAPTVTRGPNHDAPGDAHIYAALKWVMLTRLVLLVVALGLTLIKQFRSVTLSGDAKAVYWTLVFAALVNLGYLLIFRRVNNHRLFTYVQIIGDLLITALLTTVSGGITSAFTFFFIPTVLTASLILGREAGLMICVAITFLMSAQVVAFVSDTEGYLPIAKSQLEFYQNNQPRIFASLISKSGAYFMIAWLSSYLSLRLREAQLISDEIVEHLADPIVICNHRLRVTYANQPFCDLARIERDALIDKPLDALNTPLKPILADIMGQTAAARHIREVDDGQELEPYEIKYSVLSDASGESKGRMMQFTNLSKFQKLQDLQQKNKNLEMLREMSAGIAHEIRNPLSAMRGAAQEVQGSVTSEKDKRLMALLLSEVDRLNSTISEFMDLARMKPLYKESVDLYTLIRDELGLITNTPDAKRITLSIQQKGDCVTHLDKTQITKVFMNLARNAIEAMVGNGIYDVQIDGSDARQIVVVCRDSGAGIPEKDVEHIFTPFYTTKEQGTGIGLYLVQRIVEDHSGTIRVTSRQSPTDDGPAGTTFTITLPRPQHT